MAAPNQRVGEYVLERQIGRGAFGEVWLGRHHVWPQRLVAVKIPTDPAYVRDLQREGATVQALEQINIVRAIGADPFAQPPYLITEYIPGQSLRALLQSKADGKLAERDAVAILSQVLKGLSYAHGQGIVHRDVKPENILIDERAVRDGYAAPGMVKLTDFGLGHAADALRRGAVDSIAYSGSTSGNDRVVGSEQYMSPEQRVAGDVDGRTDLYACGVVLFEMLTGHRPVGTEVPSDVDPSLPKYLDDVIRGSYARIEKRFGSADRFLEALQQARVVRPAPTAAPKAEKKEPVTQPAAPVHRGAVTRGLIAILRGTLGGAVLFTAASTLAAMIVVLAIYALMRMGTGQSMDRRLAFTCLYGVAGCGAWGGVAGGISGLIAQRRTLFGPGAIASTMRSAAGIAAGGALGFGSIWLAYDGNATAIPLACASAAAGAFAGALIGCLLGRSSHIMRTTLVQPMRVPTAYYPGFAPSKSTPIPVEAAPIATPRAKPRYFGAHRQKLDRLMTTAKAVIATFVAIIVLQFLWRFNESFMSCGIAVMVVIVMALVAHQFLRRRHHH